MIKQEIDVNGYWTVIILYNVYLGGDNQGFTYTDSVKRKSIVGIGLYTTQQQFINTLVHELKHVQSNICAYYDVAEDSEQAAYLIGYLAQQTYLYIKQMLAN